MGLILFLLICWANRHDAYNLRTAREGTQAGSSSSRAELLQLFKRVSLEENRQPESILGFAKWASHILPLKIAAASRIHAGCRSHRTSKVGKPMRMFSMLLCVLNLAACWQVNLAGNTGCGTTASQCSWSSSCLTLPLTARARACAPHATVESQQVVKDDERDLALLHAAASATAMLETLAPVRNTTAVPLAASWSDFFFDCQTEMGSYIAMAEDDTRTPFFCEAIFRRLNKTNDYVVLDIGTGPFCLLAIFAARAGARRVYAVEANPVAAKQARASVAKAEAEKLVPSGVIEVIEGFSTEVNLPERADLLVAEIVGNIATAEGIVCTMRDAQARHLKRPHDPASYIPQQVQTWCAPASYLLPSLLRPPFSGHDFAASWGNEPAHVTCTDTGLQLLSEPQLLEELDFSKPLPSLESVHSLNLSFTVNSECIAQSANTHRNGICAVLTKIGCLEETAYVLADSLAHSIAGLACWPRLVLDESINKGDLGGEVEDQTIIVESRGAQAFTANQGSDESVVSEGAGSTPIESHWDTIIALLSPRPIPVSGGDIVKLTYEVKYGMRVDLPTQYELRGELLPRRSV